MKNRKLYQTILFLLSFQSCGAAIKKYMDNDPENHGFTLVALTPKATE